MTKNSASSDIVRKSPLMIAVFLLLWALSLIFYGPLLLKLIAASKTPIEFILLFAYAAMLVIFWAVAAYCIAVVIFSYFAKPLAKISPSLKKDRVAILYLICNDFQKDAATSCLKQDYPNFHLFLLDDSTKEESKKTVDAFHKAHPNRTTIVRRATRQGFKAGNLNHALHTAAAGYPFFAVIDADEQLPSNFLTRAIPYFQEQGIAFVQANHEPNKRQDSSFARDISPTILPLWHIYPSRNHYGFLVFMGHGAVLRYSAWKAVGGFPEIATEDLAFSVAIGEKGLRGVFLEDVVCYEDFAPDYTAFKRQQERYFIGTTQVVKLYLGSFLRSRNVSLTEKIDLAMWCMLLYLPPLVLFFIILGAIGIAGIFGQWQNPTLTVLGHGFVLPSVRIIGEPFGIFWSKSFQIFSVVCVLSPAFPAVVLGMKRKLNVIKLLSLNTAPYFSSMVIAWRGILGYLFTGRVIWGSTTGDHATKASPNTSKSNVWHAPIYLEICIGVLLALASLISLNFGLFAVSSCLLVGVFIDVLGWENRIVRIASVVCFILIIIQLLNNIIAPFQSQLITPFPLPIHF